MREETVPEKLHRLRDSIDSIKSAQKITGDSWILYRYKGTFDTSNGEMKFLVFKTFNPDIVATVRVAMETGFSLYPLGVRHKNGIYMFPLPTYYFNSPYQFDSTQPGTVSIVDQPVI